MAIDTNNEKFALTSFGNTTMPTVIVSPSTLGQDDQQHLLWGYPGILWQAVGAAIGDIFASPIFASRVQRRARAC